MKPFIFKMQTVLDLKFHQEEQIKIDLEQAKRVYEKSIERLKALKIQLVQVQQQVRDNQKKMKIDEIKRCNDFIPVLIEMIQEQETVVENDLIKMEQVREALIEMMKERKILEKIKSRHYKEYLKQALLEEQKEIDEMATNRFNRKDKDL